MKQTDPQALDSCVIAISWKTVAVVRTAIYTPLSKSKGSYKSLSSVRFFSTCWVPNHENHYFFYFLLIFIIKKIYGSYSIFEHIINIFIGMLYYILTFCTNSRKIRYIVQSKNFKKKVEIILLNDVNSCLDYEYFLYRYME